MIALLNFGSAPMENAWTLEDNAVVIPASGFGCGGARRSTDFATQK
jgi:hypothetical protein